MSPTPSVTSVIHKMLDVGEIDPLHKCLRCDTWVWPATDLTSALLFNLNAGQGWHGIISRLTQNMRAKMGV